MEAKLTGARVVVVSGKGGVGKTTVAAALAVAAARGGANVLLAELEDREAFAPLFGLERLAYEPQTMAPGVQGMTVEADEALAEYLQLFYKIPRISKALLRSRAVEFATHTAPGLKDILLIGKVKQAESDRAGDRPRYDLVVVDAPPTGRLPRFLNAPRAIVELVGAGPIRKQAAGVLDMITDPKRLQVVLVAQPEEMPVQECVESVRTLTDMGVATGPIVLNGMLRGVTKLTRTPVATLAEGARQAQITLADEQLEELAEIATQRNRRVRAQRAAKATLTGELEHPVVEVPHVFGEDVLTPVADRLEAAL